MGVRGLKSFLERENQIREINIGDEIQKWKRRNPDQKPVIVVDFLCLTNGLSSEPIDTICGGRHQMILKKWIQLLDAIKATDCKLVFFSDLNVQEGKIDEWLSRRNNEFDFYINLYDSIVDGSSLSTIVAQHDENRAITSTFYGMAIVARDYGEFHFSTKHEADLELAQYAKHHKAMAVVSDDTDFLIFDGSWRLWSAQKIQITPTNQLRTNEYNRYALANILSLSMQQLPLFATLMGNDFTKPYFNELNNLYKHLGPIRYKIQNIGRFIQNMSQDRRSRRDPDFLIRKIVELMCNGFANDEMQRIVKCSIDSYNTDFLPAAISDPIEVKLLHTNMYRPYMGNMGLVHGLTMPFYDLRGYASKETNLPNLLADWIRRRKAIVMNGKKDSPRHFILMAKLNFHEKFMAHTETLMQLDFSIPPLDVLYSESNDPEVNGIRWKIFAWIVSLNNEEMSAIKQLPKKFLLISTTLYVLVKNELINVNAADGILYTEYEVYENRTANIDYPTVVVAGHIRAAHMYNITFSTMRQNFAIAGLLPIIQEILQFDGVYFQKCMERMIMMNASERNTFLAPIQKYRIYDSIGDQ